MTEQWVVEHLMQYGGLGVAALVVWWVINKAVNVARPHAAAAVKWGREHVDSVVNAHVGLVASLKDSEQSRTANDQKQTELLQALSASQQQGFQRLGEQHVEILGHVKGK